MKTIFWPSGDHAGASSPTPGYVCRWLGSETSKTMIGPRPVPRPYAMCELSGDQSGFAPGPRSVCPVPSDFIKMRSLFSPPTERLKAIRSPSGDIAGFASPGPRVSCRGVPLPLAFRIQIDPKPPKGGLGDCCRTNKTLEPFALHAGPDSLVALLLVTLVWSEPSIFMVQI